MKLKAKTIHQEVDDGRWMKLISWFSVTATSSVYYQATTTFHLETNQPLLVTATNEPLYRYTWTSPQLTIACKDYKPVVFLGWRCARSHIFTNGID